MRGLHRFYVGLALRFAERGYEAVAIDYFGRTAEASASAAGLPLRGARRSGHAGHRAGGHGGRGCVAALADALVQPVFTVGFCFSGSHSWLAAAAGHGLAGAIGFYGGR